MYLYSSPIPRLATRAQRLQVCTMDRSTSVDNSSMDSNTSLVSTNFHYIIYNIRFWFTVITVPIGVMANLLCLLVVLQKKNRSLSCSMYMGALAMADTLVLLTNGSRIYAEFGPVDRINGAFCKASGYVLLTSSQCGKHDHPGTSAGTRDCCYQTTESSKPSCLPNAR